MTDKNKYENILDQKIDLLFFYKALTDQYILLFVPHNYVNPEKNYIIVYSGYKGKNGRLTILPSYRKHGFTNKIVFVEKYVKNFIDQDYLSQNFFATIFDTKNTKRKNIILIKKYLSRFVAQEDLGIFEHNNIQGCVFDHNEKTSSTKVIYDIFD